MKKAMCPTCCKNGATTLVDWIADAGFVCPFHGAFAHSSSSIEAPEKADKLARDHWKYVEELLRTHGAPPENLMIYRFHYISAFIHGYKHAMEDAAK